MNKQNKKKTKETKQPPPKKKTIGGKIYKNLLSYDSFSMINVSFYSIFYADKFSSSFF